MLKTATIVLLLTACVACSHPTIVKQQTIGGNDEDVLHGMCATKDGGFIVCGYSYSDSSGEKAANNHGVIYSDLWIIKFNGNGEIQWQKTIGGNSNELYGTIDTTSDGGYILGSISTSDISGDKTESSRGAADIWIIKLDSVGNIQWDKTLGGSGNDVCHAVKQTMDGGYIIAGASNSDISGDKTENCRGDFDDWMIKLDDKGKIQWERTLGGEKWEFPGGVELTADNGIIMCGNSASDKSVYKSENNRGKRGDFWVVKLDKNGNKVWDKTIGGDDDDMALAIRKTIDGTYLMAGFSSSNKSFEKSENSKGGLDIWIVKIDSMGNKIWDKTIGGDGEDQPVITEHLEQTPDGGCIINGLSNSGVSGTKTDSCRGNYDCWITKLNKLGNIEWNKTLGGPGKDEAIDVIAIGNHKFVIGGNSSSEISGDKSDSSRGKMDYWIVYLKE